MNVKVVWLVGGGGFIGTYLAHELRQRGYLVEIIGRGGPDGAKPLPHVMVDMVRPDSPWAALRAAFGWGPDSVIPWMESHRVPTIVLSSTAVYDRPLSSYGVSKLIQERAVRHPQRLVIRLPHITGNGTSPCVIDYWRHCAAMGRPLTVYHPTRMLDHLDVNLVVQALANQIDVSPVYWPRQITWGSEEGPQTLLRQAQQISSNVVVSPQSFARPWWSRPYSHRRIYRERCND